MNSKNGFSGYIHGVSTARTRKATPSERRIILRRLSITICNRARPLSSVPGKVIVSLCFKEGKVVASDKFRKLSRRKEIYCFVCFIPDKYDDATLPRLGRNQ